MTSPPGIPPARPSSSPNRRSPPAPAPASATPSPGSARTPTLRPNNRILAVDDESVTYRYKDRAADRQRKETVAGHEFIRRFLQHVLPVGFHKVRFSAFGPPPPRNPRPTLRTLPLLPHPATPPANPAAPEPDADPQAP